MAQSDPGGLFAPERPGREFDDVFAELRVAIDEVELISGGDLRVVADLLWMSTDSAMSTSRSVAIATTRLRNADAHKGS